LCRGFKSGRYVALLDFLSGSVEPGVNDAALLGRVFIAGGRDFGDDTDNSPRDLKLQAVTCLYAGPTLHAWRDHQIGFAFYDNGHRIKN